MRRWGKRLVGGAIVLCIATAAHRQAANAEDLDHDEDVWHPGRFELGVGAQAFRHAWALYTGVTAAPFSGLDSDGLRLRAVGGYGAYTYSGRRAAGVGFRIREFEGETAFADLLAGYQKQWGTLTVKGFAGLMTSGHRMSPDDPETAIRGRGVGAKLALETWWTVSEQAWAAVDVSWGTLHHTYAGRGRLGWRLLPTLSIGIEAGAASCATNGRRARSRRRRAGRTTSCWTARRPRGWRRRARRTHLSPG